MKREARLVRRDEGLESPLFRHCMKAQRVREGSIALRLALSTWILKSRKENSGLLRAEVPPRTTERVREAGAAGELQRVDLHVFRLRHQQDIPLLAQPAR